jgi:hypothetical protein
MKWTLGLIKIRDILAQIYESKDDTFRLIDATDLSASKGNISFDNAAVTNWHNILTEAINRGAFSALIEVCIQDSGSLKLKDAYHEYVSEIQQAYTPLAIVNKAVSAKVIVGLSIVSFCLLILLALVYFGVIGRVQPTNRVQPTIEESVGPKNTPHGPLAITFINPEQPAQNDWIKSLAQLQNYECIDQKTGDPMIQCAPVAIESKLQSDADTFRWTIGHPTYEISGRAYRVTTDGLIAPLDFKNSDRFLEFTVPNARMGDTLVAIIRFSCRCDVSPEQIRSSLESTAN